MALNDRYLIFTLAGEHYGLAFKNFREVLPRRDSIPVPFAPKSIKGIVNLRGQIVSVVDLYALFSLNKPEIDTESPTVILELNQQLIAISVDSVESVLHLPAEKIENPPIFNNNKLNNFSEAITRHDRQFIIILSTEKLFSFDENDRPEAESNPSAAA